MFKVYLVLGGESTGTRLITQLLIRGGCYGDFTHTQRMDNFIQEKRWEGIKEILKTSSIVWRRSFPHNKKMVSIIEDLFLPLIENCGIRVGDILCVITVRDWFCAAQSAVGMGHSASEKVALKKLKAAYKWIFYDLNFFKDVDYQLISLESLLMYPEDSVFLFYKQMSLKINKKVCLEAAQSVYDCNFKYY